MSVATVAYDSDDELMLSVARSRSCTREEMQIAMRCTGSAMHVPSAVQTGECEKGLVLAMAAVILETASVVIVQLVFVQAIVLQVFVWITMCQSAFQGQAQAAPPALQSSCQSTPIPCPKTQTTSGRRKRGRCVAFAMACAVLVGLCSELHKLLEAKARMQYEAWDKPENVTGAEDWSVVFRAGGMASALRRTTEDRPGSASPETTSLFVLASRGVRRRIPCREASFGDSRASRKLGVASSSAGATHRIGREIGTVHR